jgi:hypothetical protein
VVVVVALLITMIQAVAVAVLAVIYQELAGL